jgi:hypothetical protein
MKTISKQQLYKLSALVNEVWTALGKPGYSREKKNSKEAKDSFRKSELFEVTQQTNGAVSWDDVLNEDFERIQIHFLRLIGKDGEAYVQAFEEQRQYKKRMLWSINKMLADAARVTGDSRKWSFGYAVAISKAEYRKMPEDLDCDELKQLLITVSARTRKAMKAAMPDSEEEAQFASADAEAVAAAEEILEPLMETYGH